MNDTVKTVLVVGATGSIGATSSRWPMKSDIPSAPWCATLLRLSGSPKRFRSSKVTLRVLTHLVQRWRELTRLSSPSALTAREKSEPRRSIMAVYAMSSWRSAQSIYASPS